MTTPPPASPNPARTIGVSDRALVIDGTPTLLVSEGAWALAGYSPQDIAERLARLKRAGLNTLQLEAGWLDSSDLQGQEASWRRAAAQLDECKRQGIYVVLRPQFRSGPDIDQALERFAAFVASYQWIVGGPIVLVQVFEEQEVWQATIRATLRHQGVTLPFVCRLAPLLMVESESERWEQLAQGLPYRVWHDGEPITQPLLLLSLLGMGWDARRRLAIWAQTFGEILLTGERRTLKTYGDLTATEVITRETGGVVFVTNPDNDKPATGSVLPYLPDLTLPPRTTLPWVHDAPVGFGPNYLAAYGGLVKSDAFVLTVRVLPDPFQGIRVYVYGEPGDTREVVVWSNHDKGRATSVTFAADGTPQVYFVDGAQSQIVALSPLHAGQTFISPTDDNAPVIIAAHDVLAQSFEYADVIVQPIYGLQPGDSHLVYALRPDGALTEILVPLPPLPPVPVLSAWEMRPEPDYAAPDFDDTDWPDVTGTPAPIREDNPDGRCWYRARVTLDEATDATLQLPWRAGQTDLWVNGERAGASQPPPPSRPRQDISHDIRLRAGANTLCVLATTGPNRECGPGVFAPATLVPSGNCYLIEVSAWQYWVGLLGEREGWAQLGAAGFVPDDPARADAPVCWFRATFDLPHVPPAARLVLRREGRGGLWVNGLRVSGDTVAGGDSEFPLPADCLQTGRNVLVLSWISPGPPPAVRLRWSPRETTVTVAL